jgi:hypothetical protein
MADIDKVLPGLKTRLRKFKQEYGMEFMERVKARTPVRTGHLQNSWGFDMKATDISIYNVADYASYINDGTPYIQPHRMLETTMLEHDDIAAVAAQKAGLKK